MIHLTPAEPLRELVRDLGVYKAAREAGKLAIGVDSNQNYLHPGTMPTSMIKRVDLAVYEAFKSARDGSWRAASGSWALPRAAWAGPSTSATGVS